MKYLSIVILFFILFTNSKTDTITNQSRSPGKYISLDGGKIEVFSEPDSTSKIIGTLVDSVIVIADIRIKDNVRGKEGTWMAIDFNGEKAFVFSAGITKVNPEYTKKEIEESENNLKRIKELMDNYVLSGKTFYYGIGCSGSTESEYYLTMKFIDESNVTLHYSDNENSFTASGKYIRKDNNVKITITKSSMNMKSNNMNLTLKVCDDFPKCERIVLHELSDPANKNYAESWKTK
ncbi:MAG TPA: hypothetical protein PLE16_06305 [Spirochaetota bacterium]|jgi:hypothetical protein|nr:hypothetical protein [Spirochaetota bacterium]HPM34196.1 hypothetical protein [Spirochaetota bacterium]HPY04244.1 hypothetical protein [Spirochaetota bacterium]HQA52904.1 hypothetical protein [Spirochaetota bacterium]